MSNINEAVNGTEETVFQNSPSDETNQTESEISETGENLDKTPENEEAEAPEEPVERNWRALREENERLKEQLKTQPTEEVNPLDSVVRGELGMFLSQDDKTEVRLQEMRAEQAFPELETDYVFGKAAKGAYLEALANYNQSILQGKQAPLPNAYKIAKEVKREFDSRYGEVSKKAEVEGAKKAQKAKESKLATTDAESRSDRGRALASSDALANLQERSREGSLDSLVERLERSKL